jgi:hypothetical protein
MNGLMAGMDRRLQMGAAQPGQSFTPLEGPQLPTDNMRAPQAEAEAGPSEDPRYAALTQILGRNIMKDRAQKAAAMKAAQMAQSQAGQPGGMVTLPGTLPEGTSASSLMQAIAQPQGNRYGRM